MKIKIGAIKYDLDYVSDATMEEAGDFQSKKNLIRINKEIPKEQQEVTLLHEILHAINSEISEKDVEFLSQALYQVFKDNKHIEIIS